MHKTILNKAQQIKLMVCDVDGVLTDGQIYYAPGIDSEIKAFNTQDGLGIKLLQQHNIHVALISGRGGDVAYKRKEELGIKFAYFKVQDKLSCLQELLQITNINAAEACFIGDDLPDLAAMQYVALGVAVANSVQLILEQADWVTQRCGGHGAVREVCDLILNAQNISPITL